MRKKTLLLLLMISLSVVAFAQKKEVHILSMNDMHAAMDKFPQLAAVADSLRAIDPALLIFSAGDNRTGNPLNDLYEIPAYPMVALMNQIGFNATALGNHEFDSHPEGLARLIGLSNFRYLCANIQSDPSLNLRTIPYQFFDVNGVRVCVIGAIQLGVHGIPDTHPNNVKGITFTPVKEAISQYERLSKESDVIILLSHIGYEADVEMAKTFPWIDLIIGGHSHTQLTGGEMHGGVLVTQDANRLGKVTYTTLTVENGKVTDKKAENIDIESFPRKNKIVDNMVTFFSDNPAFRKVLAVADTPFENFEELGCMMCDAVREETGADICLLNAGGIRYDTHPAGDFTVSDVLALDPFGNTAVEMTITAEELRQMILSCHHADECRLPYLSGIQCEVAYNNGDPSKIKSLKLLTMDGKNISKKKTFKVVTNSYTAAISDSPRKDQGTDLNRETSDMTIKFLEKQKHVSYQGVKRILVK